MAINIHGKSVDLKEYTLAVYKEGAAWLRDYVTAIKNGQFHPYTKLERKAREATRNEPWLALALNNHPCIPGTLFSAWGHFGTAIHSRVQTAGCIGNVRKAVTVQETLVLRMQGANRNAAE